MLAGNRWDRQNWTNVRFGSYNGKSLVISVNGKRRHTRFGRIAPVKGKTYSVALAWDKGVAAIFLEGNLNTLVSFPHPISERRVGLYCECKCRFTDVVISSDPRKAAPLLRGIAGKLKAFRAESGRKGG